MPIWLSCALSRATYLEEEKGFSFSCCTVVQHKTRGCWCSLLESYKGFFPDKMIRYKVFTKIFQDRIGLLRNWLLDFLHFPWNICLDSSQLRRLGVRFICVQAESFLICFLTKSPLLSIYQFWDWCHLKWEASTRVSCLTLLWCERCSSDAVTPPGCRTMGLLC